MGCLRLEEESVLCVTYRLREGGAQSLLARLLAFYFCGAGWISTNCQPNRPLMQRFPWVTL